MSLRRNRYAALVREVLEKYDKVREEKFLGQPVCAFVFPVKSVSHSVKNARLSTVGHKKQDKICLQSELMDSKNIQLLFPIYISSHPLVFFSSLRVGLVWRGRPGRRALILPPPQTRLLTRVGGPQHVS